MARNMQPVLKKCRTLGLDPVALGVNKKSKRNIRAKVLQQAVQERLLNAVHNSSAGNLKNFLQ